MSGSILFPVIHLEDKKFPKKGFHLDLSFQSLEELTDEIIRQHSYRTSSIDLCYNNFKDLHTLSEFRRLHTLILDHNVLHTYTVFPILPELRLLSINDNFVDNLSLFIERLGQDLPKIKFLSMMKNPAAPSYFNGGSKMQNEDYRHFVICHFAYLENLDGQLITEEEKMNAYKIYGRRWKVKRRTASKLQ